VWIDSVLSQVVVRCLFKYMCIILGSFAKIWGSFAEIEGSLSEILGSFADIAMCVSFMALQHEWWSDVD